MNRWIPALVSVGLLLASSGGNALEPLTRVVAQPGAPVRITAYGAAYQEGDPNSPEGIRHTVAYESVTDRTIVALEISLVSFDVWNEFLDRTAGLVIRDLVAGGADRKTWVTRTEADFSFQTGVAYVNRVRLDDGTFWTADLRAIAAELKKIQPDFDPARLRGKASEH